MTRLNTRLFFRPYIYNLFIFLLTRIQQPVLPYVNVYYPIRRLLMLSTTIQASPTENQVSMHRR